MSQQCCCSNALLYIFSLKVNNVQEEINFIKLKKNDRKSNPTPKGRASSLFHFKKQNHRLCYIHPAKNPCTFMLWALWRHYTTTFISILLIPKQRYQPFLFLALPGQTTDGPKWDHPLPFPCTSLTLPCCTQGSCCTLNSTITEAGYLVFYRQNGYILYMAHTSLFVI